MTEKNAARWRGILPRIGLMFGGIACAFIALRLTFTLFPDLNSQGRALFVDLRPGGERYVFTVYDGDTFRNPPGMVRPPAENEVLEDSVRWYDTDGFREPSDKQYLADTYPIAVLGDSFTEGGEIPWVDVLAEKLDTPVRNLGWRGFGPLEEALVMEQFGSPDHEWVLIGYYEGNDLSNTHTSYQQLQEDGELSIERTRNFAESEESYQPPEPVTNADNAYLYPFAHLVGDQTYDLAYVSDYLWWLNGSAEDYQASQNLALIRDAFSRVISAAGAACVGLVYIPSKEHLYFPYSDPNSNRQYLLLNGRSLRLDAEGWLSFAPDFEPQTFETVLANLNNQRDVLRDLAEELGLDFIDLTPAFEQHLTAGRLLYYPYDSHWTQTGHNLAGETVADYLKNTECGAK